MIAAPFLKWAGGKRVLAPEILSRLPKRINTYYEPMVGAGAIFFALAAEKRFKKARISDVNEELINTYRAIRDDIKGVRYYLQQLNHQHNSVDDPEAYFYKVRNIDRSAEDYNDMSNIQKAARMIYLNKTCFNGLYRVNKSGHFNAPYGKYKNPRIYNDELLTAVHETLQNVTINCQDYEAAVHGAVKGDTCYFDPPYWPAQKGGFTSYTSAGFDSLDQSRLAALSTVLHSKGVFVLLSNSDVLPIRRLYKKCKIEKVGVVRRINSKGTGRGKVGEVLITTKGVNYD